jgi:tRNA A-37 threonylcarbamoyl transferase component Bud32
MHHTLLSMGYGYNYLRKTFTPALSERKVARLLEENGKKFNEITVIPMRQKQGFMNFHYKVRTDNGDYFVKRTDVFHDLLFSFLYRFGTGEFRHFSYTPRRERRKRASEISTTLRKNGILTPEIIYSDGISVQEFIDGCDLMQYMYDGKIRKKDKIDKIGKAMDILDKMHGLGISAGDSNCFNFMVSKNDVYIIDLEMASNRDDPLVMDLAGFVYTCSDCMRPNDVIKTVKAHYHDHTKIKQIPRYHGLYRYAVGAGTILKVDQIIYKMKEESQSEI